MRRFLSFNDYFKNKFGEKVIKLSLDAGCTCPNRDGSLSTKGCIFCSESGSGDFVADRMLSINEQVMSQKEFLSKKWKSTKYIAYFQNFTNTYGNIKNLNTTYSEIIKNKEIVGLSIATRADCIDEDVLNMLKELNKKTFLWVELGLQTVNESTVELINRGYSHKVFNETAALLKKNNIRFLTHVIFGLPGESYNDMINTVKYVRDLHPWGVKFHSLYIQRNSPLYEYYLNNPFELLSKEEYIKILCDAIELIPRDIVVHRITGDPDRKMLFKPEWCADKLSVISSIDKELKNRNVDIITF